MAKLNKNLYGSKPAPKGASGTIACIRFSLKLDSSQLNPD